MKRTAVLLFSLVLFLSACTSPAPSTSGPVEQVEPTQPIETAAPVAVENTTTPTTEPTSTPTAVPPSARWYWAVDDPDTAKVIAVNQFGERRELGTLEQSDELHTEVVSLDSERALLFLDANDNLRIHLLTSEDMQEIALPSDPFYFNTELSQPSRFIVAVQNDKVVFSYVDMPGSNIRPDTGPVFLVDLTTLTAELIDETVNREAYGSNQSWFHLSQDGRHLRYRNGERGQLELRELDLVTADTRTFYTTSSSPFRLRGSRHGDLWFQRMDNIFFDLNGNQTPAKDAMLTAHPLIDGHALVFPSDCVDDCVLKVIKPFEDKAEFTYSFPWTIQDGAIYRDVTQLFPDQSLLLVGEAYLFLSDQPAALESYPNLLEEDRPLFRLTPDGQARLVGIYINQVTQDGRYILLRSSDQGSFFVYDAVADRPLFDIPIDTMLEDYLVMSTQVFDTGILVNLSASRPGEKNVYRFFYHAYVYETSTSIAWEDVNTEINSCPDLLEDGTLVCWFYRTDSTSFDLLRFDPLTGTKTPLVENAWIFEFTP